MTTGFTDRQMTPTAITTTNPVNVTIANHGLTNGQYIRASNFVINPAPNATGMYQLNYQLFIVGNVSTNTFDLFDQYYNPIDGSDYTPFISNGLAQFTLTGPSLNVENNLP